MATLTLRQQIQGTINGVLETWQNVYQVNISDARKGSFLAGTTYREIRDVTIEASPLVVFLANRGTNGAVYRIKSGSNYYRFDLPAGTATVVHLAKLRFYGSQAPDGIAVYSADGTTIETMVCY
jgi:hypothetical protein